MRLNLIFKTLSIITALIVLVSACRRELKPPTVENEVLTPILKTQLTINQIVADSLSSEAEDGLISLVYRNVLYEAQLDAFDPLNSREYDQSATLDQLILSDRTVENSVSLNQLSPILGSRHNDTIQIPEISNLSFGPEILDGSEYFDELTLDSGFMDVTIHNGFPTDLSNIEFEIRNQDAGNIVVDTVFDHVAAGATVTRTMNIAGKTMESYLEAFVTRVDVEASDGPVLIDSSDAITVTVNIRDLKVFSARAVFPAQNIIELNDTNLMDGVGNTRVTRAIAKSGFVNVEVESTIEDTLYFEYYIPEGLKDGAPFVVKETINPAPAGGSIFKKFQYDVSGYEFGLTGFPVVDAYNAFYSELIGRIDSTGRKVNITLEDSIRIFVSLSDFIPEYMEGYAGNTSVNIGPEIAEVDLFDKVSSGSIRFNAVEMSLSVENGNNVPFNVEIGLLKAQNSTTGEAVEFDLSSIPNPISVLGAPSLDEPWENTWDIDARQNINSALSIFPDQIEASLSIHTNPDQNENDLTQFGVDSNKLVAYADVEIPLDFVASELQLIDTVEFNASNIRKPESVGSGVLYITAKNSFPLSADMKLEFRLSDGTLLQEVSFDKALASGSLSKATESILAWEFDRKAFDLMLGSDMVVLTAVVSSPPEQTKIYSTMALDLSLSARFNYTYISN
ncbi:MAG: hypothetical protein Salg2KO_07600 [Salibacteraceae bacterium]